MKSVFNCFILFKNFTKTENKIQTKMKKQTTTKPKYRVLSVWRLSVSGRGSTSPLSEANTLVLHETGLKVTGRQDGSTRFPGEAEGSSVAWWEQRVACVQMDTLCRAAIQRERGQQKPPESSHPTVAGLWTPSDVPGRSSQRRKTSAYI